jgi:hypothetical protein
MDGGRLDLLAPPEEFMKAANEKARAFLDCLDWRRETDAYRPAG